MISCFRILAATNIELAGGTNDELTKSDLLLAIKDNLSETRALPGTNGELAKIDARLAIKDKLSETRALPGTYNELAKIDARPPIADELLETCALLQTKGFWLRNEAISLTNDLPVKIDALPEIKD